jgi:hypothetical protein
MYDQHKIALDKAVIALDLKSNDLDISLIGLHSFCAGGAMAMKLTGGGQVTLQS